MIENVIECNCERAVIVGVVSQLLFQPTILALGKVCSIISSAMLISNHNFYKSIHLGVVGCVCYVA